ncbi:MAG: sirohydrochlorin chelatase, partial [Planctomycetota bacterium]
LLVGHGTRDPNGTVEFFRLAEVLSKRITPFPVAACLLEFQHPTIPEAWASLVEQGCRNIRVAPLLLFAAGHARTDIPDAVAECAMTTPHVSYSQSGPLSRAAPIIDLLCTRIKQCAERANWGWQNRSGQSTTLVMVGRGSYDVCAKSDMHVLGEIVARRCRMRNHYTGFYAMAEPKLPDVLDQAAQQSANRPGASRVLVQPHLLFQGRLYDAIRSQVDQAAERHPDVEFAVGDYLGPVEEVAEALAARAEVGHRKSVAS